MATVYAGFEILEALGEECANSADVSAVHPDLEGALHEIDVFIRAVAEKHLAAGHQLGINGRSVVCVDCDMTADFWFHRSPRRGYVPMLTLTVPGFCCHAGPAVRILVEAQRFGNGRRRNR